MVNKFIFFVGLPGCGKSTYIESNLNGSDVTVVSADEIKKGLPGYDPEHPELVHQASVKAAQREVYELADSASVYQTVVLDGGGINNHYNSDIVEYVRKACPDCVVKCVFFDTPISVCLERISKRDRKVPEAEVYKKNLMLSKCVNRYRKLVDEFEKVSYFTNKYIMLDMDGTIACYGNGKMDEDGNVDFVNSELFRNLEPCTEIIDYVKANCDMSNVYVVTGCPNSIAWAEKNEWLDEHFPELSKEHRMFVGNKDWKHVFIKHLAVRNKWKLNEITLIDDSHDTLNKCLRVGMNAIHPSNVRALTNKYAQFG